MKKLPPAWALWFISPILGELVSGSTPLNEYINPFSILVLGMLYGSGAILIRELLIRWKKGWLSLLLLGLAYGIYEEGLMVRSFFDPNWMDLDKLGTYGRVLGVNWVWTEHLMIFHALISIAASITLVHILYPTRCAESWVGRRGLTWNLLAFAASLPLGALLNPYDAPDAWLGACWLAIAALGLAAWRFTPRAAEQAAVRVPPPGRFFFLGFLGTFAQFFFIYYAAEKNSPHFLVTMLLLTLYDLFILWLVLRWSGGLKAWDDRHRLSLISGSISLFLILGPLTTNGRYPVMLYSNPVLLLILWLLYRKIKRRVAVEKPLEAEPIQQLT